MRRKRCSTVKDCASDGGATTSQSGAESCPHNDLNITSKFASSATPSRYRDPRSLRASNNLPTRVCLKKQLPEAGRMARTPPELAAVCLRNSSPAQQCPRGFFTCGSAAERVDAGLRRLCTTKQRQIATKTSVWNLPRIKGNRSKCHHEATAMGNQCVLLFCVSSAINRERRLSNMVSSPPASLW
jgi:hypothetical protein